MKSKGNVLGLFSTPVYVSDDSYIIDDNLLEIINKFEKHTNPQVYRNACEYADFGNYVSTAWLKIAEDENATLWNATSVDRYILNDPSFSELNDFLQRHVDNYAYNVLNLKNDVRFYITQSWFNYNNEMSSVHRHCHANSIISGVFYVQGDHCPILFHSKDNVPFYGFEFSVKDYNFFNASSWRINNDQYKVVLFPSRLEHSVAPNESKRQRISLAFNTFMRGNVGMDDELIGLDVDDEQFLVKGHDLLEEPYHSLLGSNQNPIGVD
jgi:uncharacterized protein (TIGR02466 family)